MHRGTCESTSGQGLPVDEGERTMDLEEREFERSLGGLCKFFPAQILSWSYHDHLDHVFLVAVMFVSGPQPTNKQTNQTKNIPKCSIFFAVRKELSSTGTTISTDIST